MRIYSKTSATFIERVRTHIKDIMRSEMNIDFKRTRFTFGGMNYPIIIVVFENDKKLGMYEPHRYRLGLNKRLMYTSDTTVIKNIIRHELAHMITSILYGNQDPPHGESFKKVCASFGWSSDISAATLKEDQFISDKEDISSEKIINRVKKLLKLAESSNEFEAEAATAKANELLIKHNLKWIDDEETTVYVDAVLEGKKVTGKHNAIYAILETFYVGPVFNYSKKNFELEVIGDKANVELARYVANFLDLALEEKWLEAKRDNDLKGISDKNSFMKGVANGYVSKIKETQNSNFTSKELIKLQGDLEIKKNMVYKSLSFTKRSGTRNLSAENIGKKVGANLSINPALKSKKKTKLLSFFK